MGCLLNFMHVPLLLLSRKHLKHIFSIVFLMINLLCESIQHVAIYNSVLVATVFLFIFLGTIVTFWHHHVRMFKVSVLCYLYFSFLFTYRWTAVSVIAFSTGYTTLWRDHFGATRFVVALFGIAHLVAGPFWSGPFCRKFHKNNFFSFCFHFLIFKKNFRLFSIFFFQNQSKDFLLILISFHST